ncbi:methylated-DNA--protein-cysteine methyltransferase [Parasteatoda tepidariorum]|uniref:methylated-DNA--protein-cysteine methyltransferase n=1 Tax=Parasteatoda tepidariorum TaxID=114398 RepID=UPI00077FC248|nr:methylated-DNA--protein-cysteine methyltransferase [Parasteatoda tepidariorum]
MCTVQSAFFNTSIGVLFISCCKRGVHSIDVKNCINKQRNLEELDIKADYNSVLTNLMVWLKNYFEASNKILEGVPTICPTVLSSKGKFTEKVWKTLFTCVPFGTSISYGGLAELSGNSSASRAVGTAMKNNPVPILIPCHRVIKSDGSIGHYSGGNGVKEWLLKHEKNGIL